MAISVRLPEALFSAKTLLLLASLAAAGLIGVSLLQDIAIHVLGIIGSDQRVWVTDVDSEQTLPAWFSTLLLLAAAAQLFAVARLLRDQPTGLGWLILSLAFVLLSADEAVSLHGKLSGLVPEGVETTGLFAFAWVIPALIICAIGFVLYLPLLLALPRRVRNLLAIAVVMFLGGALGVEMVGGATYEQAGDTLAYRLLATLEEALEMFAVIVLLYGLRLYIELLEAQDVAPAERPS
ncbi:MAG TPA: hypothetical protein VD906_06480 [Caulobacteraceae bacterium]|nr:hypothetical protein [Caulobacteraceae bacterium]